MSDNDYDSGLKQDRRSGSVSNGELWNELRYLRKKLDSLETKVMIMFGTVGSISTTVAIFELLRNQTP